MRQSDRKFIRAIPFCRSINNANFAMLTAPTVVKLFPKHTLLFREGDLPDYLHIIVEGSVEIFGTQTGHECTVDVVQAGVPFALSAVVCEAVYLASARTLSRAKVAMIPAQTVRHALGRDAAFLHATTLELAERNRRIVRSLKNEKLRTGTERLANWLLRTRTQQGHQRHVELRFGKRALASHLGMTPENLSRNLRRLSNFGIKNLGRTIVIENATALESFAKPSALIDD